MATFEQDIPELNLVIYEDDDRIVKTITVKNADGSNYSFTGKTATMIIDSTRPLTTTADLTLTSAGGDLTLSAGSVSIDAVHGLSLGTYEYDFIINITEDNANITLFKGTITVKQNV